MLKKDITYKNLFTDEEVTETHYFHISKADFVEWEIESYNNEEPYKAKDGNEYIGLQAKLARMTDTEDGKAILMEIKDFIRRSYGLKDGDRFRKSQEISDDFMSSEAFSQLLFELGTDPVAAGEFVSAVVPGDLAEAAAEAQKIAEGRLAQERAKNGAGQPEGGTADRGTQIAAATPDVPVTLTAAEVREMDSGQLQQGIQDGRYKLA